MGKGREKHKRRKKKQMRHQDSVNKKKPQDKSNISASNSK